MMQKMVSERISPVYTYGFNRSKRECQICGRKYVPKCACQKYCGRKECLKVADDKRKERALRRQIRRAKNVTD